MSIRNLLKCCVADPSKRPKDGGEIYRVFIRKAEKDRPDNRNTIYYNDVNPYISRSILIRCLYIKDNSDWRAIMSFGPDSILELAGTITSLPDSILTEV
jgi:hypothetical protein